MIPNEDLSNIDFVGGPAHLAQPSASQCHIEHSCLEEAPFVKGINHRGAAPGLQIHNAPSSSFHLVVQVSYITCVAIGTAQVLVRTYCQPMFVVMTQQQAVVVRCLCFHCCCAATCRSCRFAFGCTEAHS